MKGCVGILFYNDIDGLKRLIPSLLQSGVSYYDIQAFDGPFKQFPHGGQEISTDGSREYLQNIGVRIFDCGVCSHIDKTNIRFKMADKYGYDFVFAIDCDEYMMGNWPDMIKHLELCQERMKYFTYAVPFMDLDGFYHERAYHQRIFIDPKNLYYRGAHWWIFHKSEVMMQTTHWVVGCILVVHDSKIRPKEREALMDKFQEDFYEEEESLESLIPYQPSLQKQLPCGCMYGYYKEQKDGDNFYRIKDISIICPAHQ